MRNASGSSAKRNMRKIRRTNAVRKKLITAIITATLLIAGCESANVGAEQDRMMEKVEDEWGYAIYVDKDTNVMYIKGSGDGGTFTVMLNADGTPKIWQREE